MGTSGPRISRPDVLRLAEALGVRWNGIDSMPVLFDQCIEHGRRLARRGDLPAAPVLISPPPRSR